MKDSLIKYYVFFDVDNTLIKIKSMFDYLYFFYKKKYKYTGYFRYFFYYIFTMIYEAIGIKREILNKRYYKIFKGYYKWDVDQLSVEWFNTLKKEKDFYIKRSLEELRRHQKNGARIVFVSGSFMPCICSIAKHCQVSDILATKIVVKKGRYTGEILNYPLIGEGKAKAILEFVKEDHSLLSESYAYGDHISDLSMLYLVSYPIVVCGDKRLEEHAKRFNWRVLSNE